MHTLIVIAFASWVFLRGGLSLLEAGLCIACLAAFVVWREIVPVRSSVRGVPPL